MVDGEREPSPGGQRAQRAGLQQIAAFHDSIPPGEMGAVSAAVTREPALVWVENQKMALSYHGRPGIIPTGLLRASRITPPLRGSRRSRAVWRRLMRWGEWRRSHLPTAGAYLRGSELAPHRLDKGEAPPGNAGVPPASLFLAGGDGASAQRCRQAATLPA